MLEPVASPSRTHSIHIRDHQGLVSFKQTLVHSQRGRNLKLCQKKRKKLSGNKQRELVGSQNIAVLFLRSVLHLSNSIWQSCNLTSTLRKTKNKAVQIINTNKSANMINIVALYHFKDWMLKRRINAIWDKESNNMFELNEYMLNMFEMIFYDYIQFILSERKHLIEALLAVSWN